MIKTESEKTYNKTSLFLLPALNLPSPLLIANGFKNAYLCDHEHDVRWDFDNCLYLLFEPREFNENFEKFCELLRGSELFKEEYDIAEGKVMFVMEVPSKYGNIISSFKQGKYSEFNTTYINECVPMLKNGQVTRAWRIFHRDKLLGNELAKELGYSSYEKMCEFNKEVYSSPDIEDEIYRYNKELDT